MVGGVAGCRRARRRVPGLASSSLASTFGVRVAVAPVVASAALALVFEAGFTSLAVALPDVAGAALSLLPEPDAGVSDFAAAAAVCDFGVSEASLVSAVVAAVSALPWVETVWPVAVDFEDVAVLAASDLDVSAFEPLPLVSDLAALAVEAFGFDAVDALGLDVVEALDVDFAALFAAGVSAFAAVALVVVAFFAVVLAPVLAGASPALVPAAGAGLTARFRGGAVLAGAASAAFSAARAAGFAAFRATGATPQRFTGRAIGRSQNSRDCCRAAS
ncbi:hypothetical protein OCH239_18405 [Roseivivax halodurans JCM 10272]|uniref:Uncharacterized protein n=1 Tax=Roseivivax halodurans JCM 10272 TaxID=1449350 RepID=X7EHC7_9RHOB|nr:hypothetical protein OCH239_18405 [Roseivivax halodurans JCM 10272]